LYERGGTQEEAFCRKWELKEGLFIKKEEGGFVGGGGKFVKEDGDKEINTFSNSPPAEG